MFRTRILKKECFFTIDSNVDKKCILFSTEIIFRSVSKVFALVHHTFSSTNKSRSVSFLSWVFLKISEKLLVRTRNPKIDTNLESSNRESREDLFSRVGRSDPSVPGIGPVQMNNYKAKNRRSKFPHPGQQSKSVEILIESVLSLLCTNVTKNKRKKV